MLRYGGRLLSRSRPWPPTERWSLTPRAAPASSSSSSPAACPEPRPHALRSLGKQSSLSSFFTKDALCVRRILEERRWDAAVEASLASVCFCEGLVVEVVKSLSEAKHALRFFIWMAQQPHTQPFCVLASTVAVLSRRWSHEKRLNLFIRALLLEPQSRTPQSFHMLLTGYGWAGLIDKAVETLEHMPSLGISPDSSHFMCVLDILEQEKLFYALQRVRDKMQQVGIFPDKQMYDKLIWGLCVEGHKDEALDLFEEMRIRGEKPGFESYQILISMFSKADQALKVLSIINELLVDGFEPDRKALNALIRALCSSGKLEEALEVTYMMIIKSLNPNLMSLTMVTDGFFKLGDVDKVLDLYMKLNKKSIPTITFEERLLSELRKSGRMTDADEVIAAKKTKDSETS